MRNLVKGGQTDSKGSLAVCQDPWDKMTAKSKAISTLVSELCLKGEVQTVRQAKVFIRKRCLANH